MALKKKYTLEQLSEGACYLRMPGAPRGAGVSKRMETVPVSLSTEAYIINFDYADDGTLIGIEVVD